tara:strand:+ start:82 stop:456 length:375 start_codon:yes stop_codon:yes gene_type:complete
MDPDAMKRLLNRYPPPAGYRKPDDDTPVEHLAPRKLPIERTLDLHGCTVAEATSQLDAFVRRAARDGVRKILVVHGKGSHPGSEGALKTMVREFFETSPHIGTTGHPGAEHGGAGATWAIVRRR